MLRFIHRQIIETIIVLLFTAFTSTGLIAQTATPPSAGDGSSGNPYQIATLDNLYWISQTTASWDKYFLQTDDIDASTTSGWDGGSGFSPIGESSTVFSGSYDGDCHTINGLYIHRTSQGYVGLFGLVIGGTTVIKNLGLNNVDIEGQGSVGSLAGLIIDGSVDNCYSNGSVKADYNVGGLVGFIQGNGNVITNSYSVCSVTSVTTISNGYAGGLVGQTQFYPAITNCYSTGTVTGPGRVGGLVGYNESGVITNSHSTGSVNATGALTGGLVGDNGGGSISNCYSTGDVNSSDGYVGGLVGWNPSGSITLSFSTGNVYSTGNVVGGLVGGTNGGSVTNSYSTGSVAGNAIVGGLVGSNDKDYLGGGGIITNSYSAGLVTGTALVGGLVGSNLGTVNDSFWDTDASGQAASAGGTGKITVEMQTLSTFTNAGWDFATIWKIDGTTNSGYPFLSTSGLPAPTLSLPSNFATDQALNVELSWDPVPGADQYFLEVNTNPCFSSSTAVTVLNQPQGSTSKAPGGLNEGTKYYWRVTADNSNTLETSAPSGSRSFTTAGQTVSGIIPPSGSVGVSTSPTLDWPDGPPGTDKYHLEVNLSQYFNSTIIYDGIVTQSSYQLSNLSNGTTYYWRVTAQSNSLAKTATPVIYSFSTMTLNKPSVAWPKDGAIVYSLSQKLSWYMNDPTGGPFKYDVQYTTDNNFVNDLTSLTDVTDQNIISSLTNGNLHYHWRVRSKNAAGFYSDWVETDFYTSETLIGAAVTPIANWPSGNYIVYSTKPKLSWYFNNPPLNGTTLFDVEIEEFGTSFNYAPTSGLTDIGGYEVTLLTDLTPGKKYHWQVRSKNSGNISDWSNEAVFTVNGTQGGAPLPILSWPKNGDVVYSLPPSLSWYLSAGATGVISYDLVITDVTTNNVLATPSTSSTNFVLNGLIGGHQYSWTVQTHNDGELSGYQTAQTFTVNAGQQGAPKPVASSPTNGVSVFSTTPKLSWYLPEAVSGTPDFDLELTTVSGDYSTPVRSYTGKTGYSFTIPNGDALTAGETYYWHVRTNNNGQTSDYSDEESFKVDGTNAGSPTPITGWPVGGATVYTTKPNLSWYTNSGTQGTVTYEIEIKTASSNFNGSGTITTTNADHSYTLTTDLQSGTAYHWRVKLHSTTTGASAWSDENVNGGATFSTVAVSGSVAAPMAGDPVNNVLISSPTASLSWYLTTAPAADQKYRVELSRNADMSSPFLQIDNVDTFNKLISSLTNGTYYWRVQAKTDDGKYSNYSNIGSFQITGVTAVDNETNVIPETFTVSQNYPNPFNPSTIIKFGLPEASFVSIKIYNVLGQEVKNLLNDQRSAGTHSVQWNGDNNFGHKVSSGTYIYRVVAGNNVATKKMILMK